MVEKIEKTVETIVIKDGRQVNFEGQSTAQAAKELGFKTGKELEQWLASIKKDDLIFDYHSRDTAYILNNYLISEGAYGTSAPNYFFVDIDDFNNNYKSSGIIADNHNHVLSNTILGRISIPNPANTILFGNASDKVFKMREYFGPITITRLDLKLLDRFGNLINLQNNDWSVSLEFTVLYQ